MVNVAALQFLFPGISERPDFEVRDEGDGPFIAQWPESLTPPADEELEIAQAYVAKAQMCAAVAARRYAAETSGTLFSRIAVDTGRDSQALITGAAVAAMLDHGYTLNWKTPAGFVALTADQVLALATAVRAHVQACFDREAELLEALDAGEFSEGMLEEGWPDESVSATPAG